MEEEIKKEDKIQEMWRSTAPNAVGIFSKIQADTDG